MSGRRARVARLTAVVLLSGMSTWTAGAAPPGVGTPIEAADDAPVGGYWLSAELTGDASSRADAVASLETDGVDTRRRPIDAGPPGAFVGSLPDVQSTLGWVSRHAFTQATSQGEPDALWTVEAPAPGGGLLEAHGVLLRSLLVSGATPELGLRTIAWPSDQRGLLPSGVPWVAAALLVDRAPVFAAPAPVLPPAAQRHAMAHRSGGLFVLGWLDRCTEDRQQCLRWAQVVARRGDRFSAGYLPAYLVAPQDAWVPGSSVLPRAVLVRSGVQDGQASLLLVARDRRGELHRKRIRLPMLDGHYPDAKLTVEGERAFVDAPGVQRVTVGLDAAMDLRIRESQAHRRVR